MTRQSGYTLVESVLIIVIIGVLLALAIPKFINAGVKARTAVVNQMVTAIASTVTIVKSGFYLNGGIGPVVMSDGSLVSVVTTPGINNGVPLATAAGIGNAMSTYSFVVTYVGGGSPSSVYTLQPNCLVTYSQATGIATATTSGC